MNWNIIYYNEALQEEIMALPAGIQARYLHLTKRMCIHGANLGMPHTKPIKDGLFELRMKSKEGIGRVFYCTLVNKKIVMGTSINSGRDRLRSQIHRIKAQIAGNNHFIAQICNAEAVDLGFKMYAHELIEVPLCCIASLKKLRKRHQVISN